MRLADISLNEDTGRVGHSVGHTSQHHLAAQHAGSLTVLLRLDADRAPRPPLVGHPSELASAIFEWIEAWYKPRRRHSALGYRSPIDFESPHKTANPAAGSTHQNRPGKSG